MSTDSSQEAGQGPVVNAVLSGQGIEEAQLSVHTGALVSMHVVDHEGDAVLEGAVLDLCLQGGGIGLGDLIHRLESVHGILAVGEDGIVNVAAALTLAVFDNGHVPAVCLSGLLDGCQLLAGVVIAGIVIVDVDHQVGGGQGVLTALDGELVHTDDAHPRSPVGAGVDTVGPAGLEEGMVSGKPQDSRHLVAGGDDLDGLDGEELLAVGAVAAPGLPVLQLVAGVAVGEELRILLTLLAGQGQAEGLGPLFRSSGAQIGSIHGESGDQTPGPSQSGSADCRSRQDRRP